MGEVAKKKISIQIWEDTVESILTQNVRLQGRALDRIEDTIENASASQAAIIYGILHDKCQSIVAPKIGESASFNMYIASEIPPDKIMGIMQKVVGRAKIPDPEDPVVMEVVSDSETTVEE